MRRSTPFALFFASGFCGLCYQVVWLRLAFGHFGVITPVISVVISVFMLGLALGSLAAGRWGQKTAAALGWTQAHLYALCEAGIGIGAFAVPTLLAWADGHLIPAGDMASGTYLLWSAIAINTALLPWCILMGATFPLMMGFLKRHEGSETSFSYLYLGNVIGAMAGTLLTANVLIELLGFRHTLAVAGGINFLIAGVSAWMGSSEGNASAVSSVKAAPPPTRSAEGNLPRALSLLFCTGFCSMALEVVWTRGFTPVIGTTIYAFAMILAIYLAATAIGSAWYRRDLARNRVWPTGALLAAIALSAFWTLIVNDPRLNWRRAGVEIGIFPLCLFLGYLTPQLIDRYSRGDPDRAGRGYAVNVAGCILGPLVASYILLPTFGVKNTMLILSAPFVVLWLFETPAWVSRWRVPAWSLTLVTGVAAIVWAMSHEEKYPGGIIRRDHTATVVSAGSGLQKHLYVNGQGITILTTITKTMAHLPMAWMNRKPAKALVICFGMGTTYRSLLSWDADTVAVELVPSVPHAFGYYHADAQAVMANPRGQVVVDDGRRFLRRSQERFDVITIDPPPPVEAAGSSLLYSTEMYALIRQRLSEDGILQQWFPGNEGVEAAAIARSLTQSFPYVKAYRSMVGVGIHYLASMRPLGERTSQTLAARLPLKARQDLIEWEAPAMSPKRIFQAILSQELPIESLQGANPRIVITDDRPYNEYYFLRRNHARWQRTVYLKMQE